MSEIRRFSWATIRQVFTKPSYSDPLFCRFLRPETEHSDTCFATFQLFDVLTAFCFISQSNNFKHSYKRSISVLYLTNKEALTVLCSVVKHLGSG